MSYKGWLTAGAALAVAATATTLSAHQAATPRIAGLGVSQDSAGQSQAHPAAIAFVRRVFAAAEAGNAKGINHLVEPRAKAILFDGQRVQLTSALLAGARGSTDTLSDFEVLDGGRVLVVAFYHRVSRPTSQSEDALVFRESWVVERKGSAFRLFAAASSLRSVDRGPNYRRPAVAPRPNPVRSAKDQAAVDFVTHYFSVYIAKQLDDLKRLFWPGGKFVQVNGDIMDAEHIATMLSAPVTPPKFPPPARRQVLSDFEFHHVGPIVVVMFNNHVPEWRTGHPEIEHAFAEMWVLRKTQAGLRLMWSAGGIHGGVAKAPAAPSG